MISTQNPKPHCVSATAVVTMVMSDGTTQILDFKGFDFRSGNLDYGITVDVDPKFPKSFDIRDEFCPLTPESEIKVIDVRLRGEMIRDNRGIWMVHHENPDVTYERP